MMKKLPDHTTDCPNQEKVDRRIKWLWKPGFLLLANLLCERCVDAKMRGD